MSNKALKASVCVFKETTQITSTVLIKKKMKYYAVKNGRSNGVYSNWSDCKRQVDGYSGNQYKSFSSKSAAEAYVNSGSSSLNSSSSSSRSGDYSSGGYRSSGYKSSGSTGSRSSYSKSSSSYSGGSSSSSYTPSTSYSSGYVSHYPSSSSSSSSSKIIDVYTDGASKNNQARKQGLSKAGYGVYYGPGDSRNYSGRVSGEQTNQRGELEGIRHALKNAANEAKSGNPSNVRIHTDSKYSMESVTNWGDKWEKNGYKTSTGGDVVNQDMIKECRSLVKYIKANSGSVEFVKVKGHSGNHGNDMADKLAVEGCNK